MTVSISHIGTHHKTQTCTTDRITNKAGNIKHITETITCMAEQFKNDNLALTENRAYYVFMIFVF